MRTGRVCISKGQANQGPKSKLERPKQLGLNIRLNSMERTMIPLGKWRVQSQISFNERPSKDNHLQKRPKQNKSWKGFFAVHILNACSHVGAAWLPRHYGLVNTMVFTHLPSSLFLMAVPFRAPSFKWAVVLFLCREAKWTCHEAVLCRRPGQAYRANVCQWYLQILLAIFFGRLGPESPG